MSMLLRNGIEGCQNCEILLPVKEHHNCLALRTNGGLQEGKEAMLTMNNCTQFGVGFLKCDFDKKNEADPAWDEAMA